MSTSNWETGPGGRIPTLGYVLSSFTSSDGAIMGYPSIHGNTSGVDPGLQADGTVIAEDEDHLEARLRLANVLEEQGHKAEALDIVTEGTSRSSSAVPRIFCACSHSVRAVSCSIRAESWVWGTAYPLYLVVQAHRCLSIRSASLVAPILQYSWVMDDSILPSLSHRPLSLR